MEYTPILRQAFGVALKNRVLWLFSFFATGAVYNISFLVPPGVFEPVMDMQGLEALVLENLPLIVVAGIAVSVVAVAVWVVSIVANGGLVRLADDAYQGLTVRGLSGWKTGFRLLGRIFLLGLALFVPYSVIAATLTALIATPLLLGGMGDDLAGPVVVFCGGMMIVGPLLMVGGILVDILASLGLRHAVLGDFPAIHSIGRAWGDLRARFKNVMVIWLLLFVIGMIVFGVMTSVTMLFESIQMVVDRFSFWGAVGVGLVDFLLFTSVLVIWWTFHSGVWTLFYRRLGETESPASDVFTTDPAAEASPPETPFLPTAVDG